ncbi:MAG: hypothetical protein MUC96_10280 [Myxococcaceae bacterium]|jgi:hypothetical protein|nr:hypothetical protein [Myxococcaceae bacterium]
MTASAVLRASPPDLDRLKTEGEALFAEVVALLSADESDGPSSDWLTAPEPMRERLGPWRITGTRRPPHGRRLASQGSSGARSAVDPTPSVMSSGAALLLLLASLDGGEVDAGVDESTAQGIEAFEAFEPVAPPDAGSAEVLEAFSPAPTTPTVRLFGQARAETSVDTRFDSPRNVAFAENVAEGRLRVALGVDVKVNERIRLVLEGRAQVRLATQREFDRAKGFFEPLLGDAYVDVYSPKVDLRVGNQRVALGANAALAPADALNPRDLRESFVAGDLDAALLPVPAVRAQGTLGQVSWLAAYVPFFQSHRYFVFGQDEALLQPALAPSFDTRRVDPSVEDFAQERFLETRRPPPFLGDVALRLRSSGKWKVGGSWVWMNEKMPRVVVDPEVQVLASANAAGRDVPQAAAASVLNRFQAGETLFRGTYARTHLFSLEASGIVGPAQLDVDVTFSPRQTFFDAEFRPVDKSAVTWVVGLSQASDSKLVYALTYLGLAIPSIGADEQLVLLEPSTARGAPRTAWFHLFVGTVSYALFDDRLLLELRGAVEPIGRSFTLGPKVTWKAREGLDVYLAGEAWVGNAFSPFGYFSRNSKVLLGARLELF